MGPCRETIINLVRRWQPALPTIEDILDGAPEYGGVRIAFCVGMLVESGHLIEVEVADEQCFRIGDGNLKMQNRQTFDGLAMAGT